MAVAMATASVEKIKTTATLLRQKAVAVLSSCDIGDLRSSGTGLARRRSTGVCQNRV
jgi:hypothetical protein